MIQIIFMPLVLSVKVSLYRYCGTAEVDGSQEKKTQATKNSSERPSQSHGHARREDAEMSPAARAGCL